MSVTLDKTTIDRVLITFLIGLFVSLYKVTGFVEKLSRELGRVLKNPFIRLTLVPATSGLLSVLGGALMSAPIVDALGDSIGLSKSEKLFVNVWYGHVIFLVYPLSTFLIFISAITNVDLWFLIFRQFPVMLFMILIGYVVLFKHSRKRTSSNNLGTNDNAQKQNILIKSFALMVVAIAIALVLSRFIDYRFEFLPMNRVSMVIGVSAGIILLARLTNANRSIMLKVMKDRTVWELVLIACTAMWLRKAFSLIDTSSLIRYISSSINPLYVTVLLSFAFAFMTGMHITCAILAIPIIQGLTQITPSVASLIYLSAFLGYLVSPLHLCLIYTVQYLSISIVKGYKYLIPPVIATLMIALLLSTL